MSFTVRPRALPRYVAPFPAETRNSYLHRLMNANGLTTYRLSALIGLPVSLLTVEHLAALTGRPEIPLLLALPDLRVPRDPRLSPYQLAGRTVALWTKHRNACHRCVKAKGIPHEVTIWARHDQNVCLRHQLWIGHRTPRAVGQVNMSQAPDILQAQRRHRKLIHKYGQTLVANAFRVTAGITSRWHTEQTWARENFQRRTTLLLGPGEHLGPGHPLTPAITYPETIALTGMIANPHWRHVGTQILDSPTASDRFCREVTRRTGIDQYHLRHPWDQLRWGFLSQTSTDWITTIKFHRTETEPCCAKPGLPQIH